MNFLEKDLEQIIYESSRQELDLAGLRIKGKMFRQLKIGNYGIADIVTFYKHSGTLNVTVYELKKDKAGISAFLQGLRYCKGIDSYIRDFRNKDIDIIYEIVIIGREIDIASDYIYLTDFLNGNICYCYDFGVSNYSYSYNIDGLKFHLEEGYKLINENF